MERWVRIRAIAFVCLVIYAIYPAASKQAVFYSYDTKDLHFLLYMSPAIAGCLVPYSVVPPEQ